MPAVSRIPRTMGFWPRSRPQNASKSLSRRQFDDDASSESEPEAESSDGRISDDEDSESEFEFQLDGDDDDADDAAQLLVRPVLDAELAVNEPQIDVGNGGRFGGQVDAVPTLAPGPISDVIQGDAVQKASAPVSVVQEQPAAIETTPIVVAQEEPVASVEATPAQLTAPSATTAPASVAPSPESSLTPVTSDTPIASSTTAAVVPPVTSPVESPDITIVPSGGNGLPESTLTSAAPEAEFENGLSETPELGGMPAGSQDLAQSIGIVTGTIALLAIMVFAGLLINRRVKAKKSGSPPRPILPTFRNPFSKRPSSSPFRWKWSSPSTNSLEDTSGRTERKQTNSEMINTLTQAAYAAEDGQQNGLGAGGATRETNYFATMEGYWSDDKRVQYDEYHQAIRPIPEARLQGSAPFSPGAGTFGRGEPVGRDKIISFHMPPSPGRRVNRTSTATALTASSDAWFG